MTVLSLTVLRQYPIKSLRLRSGMEVRDVMRRCTDEGFNLTDRARMEIRHFVASYWD